MSDPVIVARVPDWMMFDGLYASNGALYVVTDDPALVPDRSHGFDRVEGRERTCRGYRVPTDKELQVKSAAGAKTLFGSGAGVLSGVTVRLSTLLARSITRSLTDYESRTPTIQANCEVYLHTRSGDTSLTPLVQDHHWSAQHFGFW